MTSIKRRDKHSQPRKRLTHYLYRMKYLNGSLNSNSLSVFGDMEGEMQTSGDMQIHKYVEMLKIVFLLQFPRQFSLFQFLCMRTDKQANKVASHWLTNQLMKSNPKSSSLPQQIRQSSSVNTRLFLTENRDTFQVLHFDQLILWEDQSGVSNRL